MQSPECVFAYLTQIRYASLTFQGYAFSLNRHDFSGAPYVEDSPAFCGSGGCCNTAGATYPSEPCGRRWL